MVTLLVCPLGTHRDCKDTFADIYMHTLIMTLLLQGHHLVPSVLGAELFRKTHIHSLKQEF